jgi:tetratricopeptide (TPR) repeat protein
MAADEDDNLEDGFHGIVWEETDEYATFEEAYQAYLSHKKIAEDYEKAAEKLDEAGQIYVKTAEKYLSLGDQDRAENAARKAIECFQKCRDIDEKAEKVDVILDRIYALLEGSRRTINPGYGTRRGPRGYRY